jgi:hypothetical protein
MAMPQTSSARIRRAGSSAITGAMLAVRVA